MSRRDEDRILHGLHYHRETLEESFTASGEEILWLATHSYSDGTTWSRDGEFQRFDCSILPQELQRKLLVSKFELPLRYLQYRRLIKFSQAGQGRVNVEVTFAGADRAMRLHTPWGRMELWYQEHRDGFLGLLVTVAVSFTTALVAVLILDRLHKGVAEQPRIIYEVEPKTNP